MKENKQCILFAGMIISIIVVSFMFGGNLLIALLWYIVTMALYIFACRAVYKKEVVIIRQYLQDKKYDEGIEYLNGKVNSSWLLPINQMYLANLMTFYMVKDNIDEVKKLRTKYKFLCKYKGLEYNNFLLSLDEGFMYLALSYASKVMKLKNPMFDKQKDRVKDILNMIETGVVDENIYNETDFPILKRICLKVKAGTISKRENVPSIPVVTRKDLPKKQKVLFATILGLVVTVTVACELIVTLYVNGKDCINDIEEVYYASRLWWLGIIVAPFGLASLIYSLYLDRKKYGRYALHLVMGVISFFGALLFTVIYGMTLSSNYSTSTKRVNDIESVVGVNLSDDFSIITEYVVDCETSIVRLEDDVITFDEKWIDSIDGIKGLHALFEVETKKYEKYLIYSIDGNVYNQNLGKDEMYIAIAYDEQTHSLYIFETIDE